MASRSLDELRPAVAVKAKEWLKQCARQGVQVLVYNTYRSIEEQNKIYAQGRTAPGKKVTNARGGRSWHNFRRAWDAVPMVNGLPDWSFDFIHEHHWQVMVNTAREMGIEWGGDFTKFKGDWYHFQIRDGLTLDKARREV